MGRGALKSHKLSKKHATIENAKNFNAPLFQKDVLSITDNNNSSPITLTSSTEHESLNSSETSLLTTQPSTSIVEPQKSRAIGIKSYMDNKDEVTKAEIMWCLKSIVNHNSLRDIENSISLMKIIFTDSEIAKKLKLSKDKASYVINYGLSNYFHNQLAKDLETSDLIAVSFDESLNKM
ncbi:uncharacterized protein LOC122510067 [Leptopilina heterotoma]|uniref:uncharacterized protein LOC122510067 n=1 Tax=Leptopilina heterotoma TaxID=63436 RepID=UPI001CA80CBF|nr:uncharacterized protein LOC122510067 [Leptopilina heterotoma]